MTETNPNNDNKEPHFKSPLVPEECLTEECPICYEEIPVGIIKENKLNHYSHHISSSTSYDKNNNNNQIIEIQGLKKSDNDSTVDALFCCKHKFCQECLRLHCIHCIADRTIPINCPAEGCDTIIDDELVHDVLCPLINRSVVATAIRTKEFGEEENPLKAYDDDEENQVSTTRNHHHHQSCLANESWLSYKRYKQMKNDPDLIECPKCNTVLSGKLSKPPRTINCIACHHKFCSKHGDKHNGMSCLEYRRTKNYRKDRKHRQKTEKFITRQSKAKNLNIKPCSRCNTFIEKSGGCDHIICLNCNEDFCFKCGTHVYLTGEGTIRTCSNCKQGYIDHRKMNQYRCGLCIQLPFLLPCYIINVLCRLLYVIGSCCICCCFKCGTAVVRQHSEQQENEHQEERNNIALGPLNGLRFVLGYIFLPFLDILDRFGLQCCGDNFIGDVIKSIDNFERGATSSNDSHGGEGTSNMIGRADKSASENKTTRSQPIIQQVVTVDEDDEEDNEYGFHQDSTLFNKV